MRVVYVQPRVALANYSFDLCCYLAGDAIDKDKIYVLV